jgi:hypothetical protein
MKKIDTVKLTDGSEVVVVKPSPSQEVQGRIIYNRKWKEYTNAGVQTNKQLNDWLTSSGLLNPDREEKFERLRREVVDIDRKLKSGKKSFKTLAEGKAAALEARKKRFEMLRILNETSEYANKTAEAMAEQDKFQYFVSVCAFKDDKPYFEDLEDYLAREDEPDSYLIAAKFAALNNGYVEEGLQTEEDKFLYKYGFINDKGHLINKDGHLVDEDGRLVNEDGRYVNEKGEFVDTDGNPVTKDGEAIVEFEDFVDENGEVVKPLPLPA